MTRYNHRQRAPVFVICSWGFRVVFGFRQSACCRRHKNTIRTNLRNTLTEYQTTQKSTDSLENNKNNVRKELKVNEQTASNTPMFFVLFWGGSGSEAHFNSQHTSPRHQGFSNQQSTHLQSSILKLIQSDHLIPQFNPHINHQSGVLSPQFNAIQTSILKVNP